MLEGPNWNDEMDDLLRDVGDSLEREFHANDAERARIRGEALHHLQEIGSAWTWNMTAADPTAEPTIQEDYRRLTARMLWAVLLSTEAVLKVVMRKHPEPNLQHCEDEILQLLSECRPSRE